MTGFGRAEGAADQWRARVECKSVNKKRLDVRIHLPNEFGALEPTVRDLVRDRVERGRIEVRIDIEAIPVEAEDDREETGGQLLDSDKFHALSRELRELAQRSATGPVSLEDILTFHEYFERERPVDIDEDDEVFARIVVEAADEMVESRTEEGEGLADDLLDHLEQLDEALASYRDRAPRAMDEMRSRIEERVHDALEDFDGATPDDQRLAEEIVYYTDRADVSEELQRSLSHVDNVRELIETSAIDEPVGKEIDFYLQELVRETNTLASKSADSELTDIAISAKSLVDKMREQVANVE
jgi:uncharacterized protein (TIGR00255 family)